MTNTTTVRRPAPCREEVEYADAEMTKFALAMDAMIACEMDEADCDQIREDAIRSWNVVYGSGGEAEADAIEDLAWEEDERDTEKD